MHWLWESLGLLLIGSALTDVFRTIFHPTERGTISDAVARFVWRICRALARRRASILSSAGPFAVLSIIVMWATLLILGFALLYWPHLDGGFSYSNPTQAARHHGFLDAIDLSLDSVITLTGDMAPNSSWMRLIMGLEAAFGFGILTASISWLLTIYPILERRRSLAHSIILMRNSQPSLDSLPPDFVKDMLIAFTQQLVILRSDFLHFPVTFYFHEQQERAGVSGSFHALRELSEWSLRHPEDPGLQTAGIMLSGALEEVLRLLTEYAGVPFDNPAVAIDHLAEEHLRDNPPAED